MPTKAALDVQPLSTAPARSRGGLAHVSSPSSSSAYAELIGVNPSDPSPLSGTITFRFDPVEGNTEVILHLNGSPGATYDVLFVEPQSGVRSVPTGVDENPEGEELRNFMVQHVFASGASPIAPQFQIGGGRAETVILASPDESTTLFSRPRRFVAHKTPSNTDVVFGDHGQADDSSRHVVTCNMSPAESNSLCAALCRVLTDEEGHADWTFAIEGVRVEGPPGEGSSVVSRWIGVIETESDALVAAGFVSANTGVC